MYRIEVSPGEETVLRTIEELATAIRNGLVTPRSRIYHSASQKWLPIEFHPHYKKALEIPERPRPGSTAGGAALRPPPAPQAEPAPSRPPVSSPTRSPAPSRSALLPPGVASLPLIEVEPDYPEPAPPVVDHRPKSSSPVSFGAPRPSPAMFSPAPPSPAIFSPAPPSPAMFSPAPPSPSIFSPAPSSPAPSSPAIFNPPIFNPPIFNPPVSSPAVSSPPMSSPAAPPPPAAEAPMPVARRRASGGRPLLYAGTAMVLVVGGYLVTTAAPSSRVAAEAVPAAASTPRPAPAPVPEITVSEGSADDEVIVERPAPPPASVITSVAPRSGPRSQAWSSSAGAIAPPAAPAPTIVSPSTPAPDIAPAPVELDLSTASLEVADSLAPKAKAARDTGAIGRILKAVGAPKAAQQ